MPGFVLSAERTAETFGVNRRTVAEWISAGCPADKIGPEWRLNSAEVSAWLRKRQGRQPGGGDAAAELDLREREARTVLAELKTRKELGQVVDAAEVRSAMAQIGRMYASSRENLPVQLATLLVGKSDLNEIEMILRRELRAADERVAAEIESRHGTLVNNPEGDPDGDGLADL